MYKNRSILRSIATLMVFIPLQCVMLQHYGHCRVMQYWI